MTEENKITHRLIVEIPELSGFGIPQFVEILEVNVLCGEVLVLTPNDMENVIIIEVTADEDDIQDACDEVTSCLDDTFDDWTLIKSDKGE